MSKEDILAFRKFLHDLNNKLAISHGRSLILRKFLDGIEENEFVKKID